MLRIIWFVFLIGVPAQAGPLFTSAYAGNWHGVGIQSDGSDWEMQLALGPALAMVAYPGLHCGGRWQFTDVKPDSVLGIETIEYGLENCIETGNIYVQPLPEGRIFFMWCGAEKGIGAVAVLARDSLPSMDYDAQRTATVAALDSLGTPLANISCRGNKWFGV